MTNNERLGHLLVAIPIAHVLGSAFFLWSYYTGFGSEIAIFSSASDILSVSINDMVFVYATALVIPALITLLRMTSSTPYAVDMVDALPEERRGVARAFHRAARQAFNWGALAIFIIFSLLAFRTFQQTHNFPYTILHIALQIPTIILWMTLCEKRGYQNWTFEIGAILGGFILSLFFIGGSQGQLDRINKYDAVKKNHAFCEKTVVLRQISNKFLAVLPSGERVLIAEDCKVVFRVPQLQHSKQSNNATKLLKRPVVGSPAPLKNVSRN